MSGVSSTRRPPAATSFSSDRGPRSEPVLKSIDGELSLLVRFGDSRNIEFSSDSKISLGQRHLEEDVVAADLANLIQLARYHGRYEYKQEELRSLTTA